MAVGLGSVDTPVPDVPYDTGPSDTTPQETGPPNYEQSTDTNTDNSTPAP